MTLKLFPMYDDDDDDSECPFVCLGYETYFLRLLLLAIIREIEGECTSSCYYKILLIIKIIKVLCLRTTA